MATPKNKKFAPRASTNLIEEEVTTNPEDATPDEGDTPVETAPVEGSVNTEDTEETPVLTPEEDLEPENSKPEEDSTPDEGTPKDEKDKESEEDKVTFTAETNKKPITRMVKVRLSKEYRGCIGGEWYHLPKEKVVTVPENVKRILSSEEGLLKPL